MIITIQLGPRVDMRLELEKYIMCQTHRFGHGLLVHAHDFFVVSMDEPVRRAFDSLQTHQILNVNWGPP